MEAQVPMLSTNVPPIMTKEIGESTTPIPINMSLLTFFLRFWQII